MGNLLTTAVSFWTPLVVNEIFIPAIMHPYRYGGIPFQPPSAFFYTFLYVSLSALMIGPVAVLSGLMTSSRECGKTDGWVALRNSFWPLLFAVFGILFVTMLPTLKAPLLSIMGGVPYANHVVSGLYISIFVLIGGLLGNQRTRETVCE